MIGMKKHTQLYLDGHPIDMPEVTELEACLLRKLNEQDFGELDNRGLVSTRDDGWCGCGGLERVNMIEWDDRRQLGALITSLQDKDLVIFEECDDGNGNLLWFDCAALQEVVHAHDAKTLEETRNESIMNDKNDDVRVMIRERLPELLTRLGGIETEAANLEDKTTASNPELEGLIGDLHEIVYTVYIAVDAVKTAINDLNEQ